MTRASRRQCVEAHKLDVVPMDKPQLDQFGLPAIYNPRQCEATLQWGSAAHLENKVFGDRSWIVGKKYVRDQQAHEHAHQSTLG
jgi:hypothetical protein